MVSDYNFVVHDLFQTALFCLNRCYVLNKQYQILDKQHTNLLDIARYNVNNLSLSTDIVPF